MKHETRLIETKVTRISAPTVPSYESDTLSRDLSFAPDLESPRRRLEWPFELSLCHFATVRY